MTIHDDLREVMGLLGKATPTTWRVGTYGGGQTVQHWVLYGPAFHTDTSVPDQAQDMELVAAAVNFLRQYGPALLARQEGEDDTARLDWMMHHISGRELREMGVHTIDGCDRAAIDAAMKAARSGGGG